MHANTFAGLRGPRQANRYRPGALAWLVVTVLAAAGAHAAEYHVDPNGSDADPGDAAQPWATLQHAADTVGAGDTVIVHAGAYDGFDLRTGGTAGAWIEFRAEPGVVITAPNAVTGDGINVENAAFVLIEGFTVQGAPGVIRNGFRAALGQHITFRDNRTFNNAERGFFTGFVDDAVFESNEAAGSIDEHGIYVSNSGDRPVIRDNYLHGNNGAGIHMNGDASLGGDGLISGALVERNVIVDNGAGGGSAINADGVQDSVFRNNLLIGNHATGIALFAQDGAEGSRRNLVAHNTIVNDSDGRWALTIRDGSSHNTIVNNIFLSRHGYRGAMDIHPDSQVGLASDHNIVENVLTDDSGNSTMTLAQWQAETGQDLNSLVATETELFVAPGLPGGDYHLRVDAPAVDTALVAATPVDDFENDQRPSGGAPDIGADEFDVCVGQGGEMVLSNEAVATDREVFACRIQAGPALDVTAPAVLELNAIDGVTLWPGVSVAPGGGMTVQIVTTARPAQP